LRKKFLLLLALPLLALFPLSAQEDDRLFVIAAFEFDITGRTRPDALLHNAELRVGEEIRGMEALERFVRDRTQLLVNTRVLDAVEIAFSVGEARPDGAFPVTLAISAAGTMNVIAIPVPYFHSHTGFEFDVRARDYNFLGTMSPLRLNLGYSLDEYRQSSFNVMLTSVIPFTAWGLRWSFLFENIFEYRPDVDEPFFFRNNTGLSVELPFGGTTLTVGFEESFLLNDENHRRYRDLYGDFQSGIFMSSTAFASWRVPFGFSDVRFGEVAYTVSPSMTFVHEMPGQPALHGFRRGPFAEVSHSLGLGRIDWHGNFRRGFSVSLGNSFFYDVSGYDVFQDPFHATLGFTGVAHLILADFLGLSARMQTRRWVFFGGNGYNDEAGNVLRGISDRSIHADHMLSFNFNLPFRVFVFEPSRWFGIERLRFFNFEFHASPMFDFAFFNDPSAGSDVAATGGIELVVFPEAMRSLYLRFSFGVNALELLRTRSLPGGSNREISISMGHHF